LSAAVDIDAGALARWLDANLDGLSGPLEVEKFPGGQSNPTYRVSTASRACVLRRKPFGPLLPSAHAVDREYRLIAALHPAGFPVPRPLALCSDAGVIGSAFYVMELVEGRIAWDGTLPDLRPTERRTAYENAIGTLARLHGLDHVALGLADFGRPGNFFARQVDRWIRQYRAAETAEIPAMERLIAWLPGTIPEQTRASIVHGDFRLDNLVAGPGGEVRAVLDWELSTIGDPLADFTYFAMQWVLPVDGQAGLAGTDFAATGIPTLDEAVALYYAGTGRRDLPDLHWYFSYNLFRLVGILQGVRKRMLQGNASSAAAASAAARVEPLADAAWEQARHAGAST